MHSGDSACAIPPPTLAGRGRRDDRGVHAPRSRDALDVLGLLNVQYAVKDGGVYVIEANPRASRTVPVRQQGHRRPAREGRGAGHGRRDARRAPRRGAACGRRPRAATSSVKEAVLPFNRFPDVDTILGPEMRSTGEVMGIDRSFGMAFAKSQAAAGQPAARSRARSSSRSPTATRPAGLVAARRFADLGFRIAATAGTAAACEADGIPVDTVVAKVGDEHGRRRGRPDLVGQGRSRREHAPGPGSPRRRDAHPAGRDRPRGRRASRPSRRRSRRRPASPRSQPRGRRCARCRSTTPTASCGSRCDRPCRTRRRRPARCELGDRRACRTRSSRHRGRSATAARSRGSARRTRLGAVTVKSVAVFAWPGNPPLRVARGAGRRDAQLGRAARARASTRGSSTTSPSCAALGARVIASIWGRTVDDFAVAAQMLEPRSRTARRRSRSTSAARTSKTRARDVRALAREHDARSMRAVRRRAGSGCRCSRSSRRTSPTSSTIAGAALDAGAHGLTLVNTVMGLVVDAPHRRPRLGAGGGGLSGPPIKPVALRAVYDVARALPRYADHRHRWRRAGRGRRSR